MAETCFVIQPFDGGKFDKRFEETYAPAIRAAGLVPYRVDRDPSASIPIEQIETGIRSAATCFADVTLNNPNVWFELGYAIASKKDICIVCSDERTGSFPFDIQHRFIIKYNTESAGDYENLKIKIQDRLTMLASKRKTLANVSASQPIKLTEGLAQNEIAALCTIFENRFGQNTSIGHWRIVNEMERYGYNKVGTNIGIEKLIRKYFIEPTTEYNNDGEEYTSYKITDHGIEWLLANDDKFDTTIEATQNDVLY